MDMPTKLRAKMIIMKFERFAVYGFGVDYPVTWIVELDPKSKREIGNVAFKSPEKRVIIVSWGPLEKAEKYSSSDAHAQSSLDELKKMMGSKSVELVEAENIKINFHKAAFRRIDAFVKRPHLIPFLRGRISHRRLCSLHLHCVSSKRYFIIYTNTLPEKSTDHLDIFKNVINSLNCHSINSKQN